MPTDISGNMNHGRNITDPSPTNMAPRLSVAMGVVGLFSFLPILIMGVFFSYNFTRRVNLFGLPRRLPASHYSP